MPHVKYILPSVLMLVFFSYKVHEIFIVYHITYFLTAEARLFLVFVLQGPADVSIVFLIVFCVLPQT